MYVVPIPRTVARLLAWLEFINLSLVDLGVPLECLGLHTFEVQLAAMSAPPPLLPMAASCSRLLLPRPHARPRTPPAAPTPPLCPHTTAISAPPHVRPRRGAVGAPFIVALLIVLGCALRAACLPPPAGHARRGRALMDALPALMVLAFLVFPAISSASNPAGV